MSESMRRVLLLALIAMTAACAGRRPGPSVPTSPPPVGAVQIGYASWYGIEEKGEPTASGERMDPEAFTAAHLSYPFGTVVRVDDVSSQEFVERDLMLLKVRAPAGIRSVRS